MKERKTISKDYAIRNAVFELMPTEKPREGSKKKSRERISALFMR